LLDENNDLKVVANKLKTDLNQKYGNGWQCLAFANYNFTDPELDREPNSLFWFSYLEKYFYIFNIASTVSLTTVTPNCVSNAAVSLLKVYLNLFIVIYGFIKLFTVNQ
jgi:hypothetical protein